MNLVVVLPVCRPDFHAAIQWLRWVRAMSEIRETEFYVINIFVARAVDEALIEKIRQVICGWENASIKINPEYYEHPEFGYAAMANQMFKQSLLMMERDWPEHAMLWCEPDCIPTNPLWLTHIKEEYEMARKPFMGDFHGPGPIPHMTGNGIYPPDWRKRAPILADLPVVEQGWDSQAAHQVVPQSHRSYRIQQEWIVPPMKFTTENIGIIHPETSLFHRDKTGTLIEVLSGIMGDPIIMDQPICQPSPVQPAWKTRRQVATRRGGTYILIVSCRRDADMCEQLLRSIKRNAHGFSGIVLMVPVQDVKFFRNIPDCVKLTTFDEAPEKGFLHHMIQICRADEICPEADQIVHIDSDCLMWRRTTPEDFMPKGKCLMVREHYNLIAPRNPNRLIWGTVVERAIGIKPQYDTMVRHPNIYPRAVYGALRDAVERHTRRNFDEYVFSCENGWPQGFCEFVSLGTIALTQFPEAFTIVDYDHEKDSREAGIVGRGHQYLYRPERDAIVEGWSHGGYARYKTDWDKFLAGELPPYYVK